MFPGSQQSIQPSTRTSLESKTPDCSPHHGLDMVNPSMPELKPERKHPRTLVRQSSADLKVHIPKRQKAAIVEIDNPFTKELIPIIFHPSIPSPPIIPREIDIWECSQRAVVSASHTAFTNKYSIKVELFEANSRSLGILETELHHNPGNICFFCLDYLPDDYHMKKGLNVSCISPYCNCCTKTISELNSDSDIFTKKIGKINSMTCSNQVNLYNQGGELAYGLKNGNSLLRHFRFLFESPFFPLCIPYKLALCCCLDLCWQGKSNKIKLYDYKNSKEIEIGVATNKSERVNEWQEVLKQGQKIKEYKGEEIFMCKQFEINIPEDADKELKKLIVGALIAEMPSTIDRYSC